jgi:hypothetical protein
MPRACPLSEGHFQNTTKTLAITRKPSTRVRGPQSLTLTVGIAVILDTADVVPLGPVWTAEPLAHKPVTACPWDSVGSHPGERLPAAGGRIRTNGWRSCQLADRSGQR